jgi:hypothetical protein
MVTAHGVEVAWFYRRERESECCGTRMEAAEEAAATKEEEEEEEEELCARGLGDDAEGGEETQGECVAHRGELFCLMQYWISVLKRKEKTPHRC